MAYTERQWLSADGLTLYARDYAAAVSDKGKLPIVCLHGLTRNSRDFEDVAPLLAAAGRRVIVPDMRGRGRSERDPDAANYGYATYAADVVALLDNLQVPHALFFGTSMGGAISMTVAAIAGDRIAAAILNDIGGEVSAEGLKRIAGYVGRPADVADWAQATAYVREVNRYAMPAVINDQWARIARRIFVEDREGRPVLDYDPAISVPARTPSDAAANLWAAFDQLAANRPLLVLRGALSDILAQDVAERMVARAPNVTLAVVPGVGHAPLLDEPAALDAIQEFLGRAP